MTPSWSSRPQPAGGSPKATEEPATASGPVPSLSPAQRTEFVRWLLQFHLEELNGLGDRLAYADASADPASLAQARERLRLILDALRWDANVLEYALKLASQPPAYPEDLFGPLVVIRLLGPQDVFQARLAGAPDLVRRRLSLAAGGYFGASAQ